MMILFGLLLILRVAGSTSDFSFETKIVAVEQNVTLSCPRLTTNVGMLYWIRIIFEHQPEFLGATYDFNDNAVNETPHITTKSGPGTFILHVNQIEISDSGLYYCVQIKLLDVTFLTGTFLRIKDKVSGENIFGLVTELDDKELNEVDMKTILTALSLLCSASILTVIVLVFYIWTLKKKNGDCRSEAGSVDGEQQSPQRHEVIYSAPTFSKTKAGRAKGRNTQTAKEETVYSDVRISAIN